MYTIRLNGNANLLKILLTKNSTTFNDNTQWIKDTVHKKHKGGMKI